MKFSNTKKCTFCSEHEECKYTTQFWENDISWLEQYKIKEEINEFVI